MWYLEDEDDPTFEMELQREQEIEIKEAIEEAERERLEVEESGMNFERKNSNPFISQKFEEEKHKLDDIIREGKERAKEIFKNSTCFEIIPESGKIVVLDTSLVVRSAFQALVENNIKSAPLWDSQIQDFVGMITVTDFINILRHFYSSPSSSEREPGIHQDLQEHRIKTWRNILGKESSKALMYATPEDRILDVTLQMTKSKIHRLPIIDRKENLILHIITHTRVLKFLMYNIEKPELFDVSIDKLGIGTWKNIISVLPSTPLIHVLDLLSSKGLSSIPIVDESGVLVDVYSKSDVPALAVNRTYDKLNRPISEVISDCRSTPRIVSCRKEEGIAVILNRLFERKAHRLICVDSSFKILGIVSMSDILAYFVL